ncbi:NitT/TauT family transport system permease protein [Halogranum gelatinilyticum]|uniref:NitT/TauT family transport system permease protein n=1 Tax=Halogranum gelatinilyticum TaxID=660521 RepID=A0A1G9W8F6_9EURY|nr:ABC transporter permease [Halogranum gelatinilyticum]SDM80792.1 NitT/TauT family transport system permease protein [Halogranum gelatinilyticum]
MSEKDSYSIAGSVGASADEPLLERLLATVRERAFLSVAGFGSFLLVWYIAALFQPTYLLPSPVEVAAAFWVELTAPALVGVPFTGIEVPATRLVEKLVQSLYHYIPGLLIGTTLGVSLGVAMGWDARVDGFFTPVTRVLRPIPPLAWIGFAVIWLGVNHNGATFIVAIGSFWINFYSAYSGVEGVSEDLKEVAASLGVDDDWTMIRKVVLPAASPSIMTGIRTSIGQCWMIVVAAELIVGNGVGYQILNAAQNLAMDVSVAYMLVISIVFLVSDGLFRQVEARVLDWRA